RKGWALRPTIFYTIIAYLELEKKLDLFNDVPKSKHKLSVLGRFRNLWINPDQVDTTRTDELEKAVEERTIALESANRKLIFQNNERGKRAAELIIANEELAFQNEEKEKRAAELVIANVELVFQNGEKGKRAAELIIANAELAFQNGEKEKRAAELIIANTELIFQNEEKGKRAAELSVMNTELEAFSYVSSHDLQEPLRKIIMFSQHILERENKNLSVTGKDYFSRIQSAASRMQQLINDLLAFSKLNVTERKFESTDLSEVVEEVKAELKEVIEEKSATIVVMELCSASIIRFQFQQVIHNLISNALKFSRPGHLPHIIIKSRILKGDQLNEMMLSPEKEYCHISISDNGIGFDPIYKDRIFEVFQRLHAKDQFSGTGIGLAIVKKVMDNHHGIINATGVPNGGATFNMYIPAA
ncbi:MAG TPA: ATP-binding protein, partial [Cyclobacteriaceae bacterium]